MRTSCTYAAQRRRRRLLVTSAACITLLVAGSSLAGPKRPQRTKRPSSAAAEKPWPKPAPLVIERFTLSNGMRVIVQTDTRAPIVAIGLMVDVGSRDEEKGRSGLAHFFEHMMFQGSERVKKMEHFTALESVGAELNANTSSDRTYYYEVVPKGAVELALWLESDRFAHLEISEANVENQRQTVLEERRQRYENRPYSASHLRFGSLVQPTWELGHSTIGEAKDLIDAPLDAFVSFWRTWYTPNNVVLTLVGDITVDEARRVAERYLGRLKRRAEPDHRSFAMPTSTEPTQHVYESMEEKLGQMPAFHLGWQIPALPHPDAFAIAVLSNALAGGAGSRLERKLAKETGLATRHFAGRHGRRDVDSYQVYVELSQADAAAVAQAKQIVRDAIADIALHGIGEDELRRARIGFEAGFVFGSLSAQARASWLSRFELYYGDARLYNDALEKYRSVTAEDVQRVARTWFGWDREVELDVLPVGFAALADAGTRPASVVAYEEQLAKADEADRAAVERDRLAAARAAEAAEKKAMAAEARAAKKAEAKAKKQAAAEARAAKKAEAKAKKQAAADERAAKKAEAKAQKQAEAKAKKQAEAAAKQKAIADEPKQPDPPPPGPEPTQPAEPAAPADGAAAGSTSGDQEVAR